MTEATKVETSRTSMPEAEKMKRRGCRLFTLAWTGHG